MKTPLVLGIGNPLLQDDRAGIEVIEKLQELGAPCDTLEVYTVGFEIIDRCMGRDQVIVVDACMLGNQPGSILNVGIDDIFNSTSLANSHAITLGATLKVGYELFPEKMPADLRIILIEAKDVKEFSRQCSPEVCAAIDTVVKQIQEMVFEKS
ncbi:hydrogenase maturation protease [Desulfovibrio inopinatus]|uniref:hydrogenase maturation protease n=1 Tax=Desulfovibrio inopinatus TaxID=102109 RepID=UPI00041ECAC3|nr:hydrogenase maturation protease [Desulfovibrio inopinatus]